MWVRNMRRSMKKKMRMKKITMKILLMKFTLLNDPALGLLKHVKEPLVCQEKHHHERSLKEYFHHLVRNDLFSHHNPSLHNDHLHQCNLQHHLLSLAPPLHPP